MILHRRAAFALFSGGAIAAGFFLLGPDLPPATVISAPEAQAKVDLHFVAFVKSAVDGELWELDGRRKGRSGGGGWARRRMC
ncbi:MAG: hypothetical protein HC844_06390 [Tabrizicola sp.]|nr:hypothetical protein [Tabrizicola sp.]